MGEMSHADLVKRAGKWLRNSCGCSVVMEELVAYTASGETPDAIGWNGARCILVECKRTRSDFLADKNKSARMDGARALGEFRFYFAPPGIISEDDLPDGWGLYEVSGRRVKHAGGVAYSNAGVLPNRSDKGSEVAMLLSAIRRLKASMAVFVELAPAENGARDAE